MYYANEKNNLPRQKPKKGLKGWIKEITSMLIVMTLISTAANWFFTRDMPSGVAPSIVGHTLDGQPINVAQLSKDKPVIVYFWATWCGACKFVSPVIEFIAQNNTEQSKHIFSVALSSGSDERVQRFMTAKEYQFAVLNDQNGQLSRDWNISVTPTVVVIEQGEIKSIATGVTAAVSIWFRSLFM